MLPPNFTELAGINDGRDITRGYINLLGMYMPTTDKILLSKSGGDINLYEEVARDDRVFSGLQQRFSGLTAKKLEVIPGGKKKIDIQASDFLKSQIDALNFDDITEKMLWGVHFGYSVGEPIWGREGNQVILSDLRVRDRSRFRFGVDQKLKLLTFGNPLGEDLPDKKFWHYCTGANHHDEPYGRGLGYWLYWLGYFKRMAMKWWMLSLEKNADPSKVGSYPDAATDSQIKSLERSLQNLSTNQWTTKPANMLIELLATGGSGTADYVAVYEALNTAISTVILSQSMTSESGSSLSQAQVHQDVGNSVMQSDEAIISESFNRTIAKWLTEWNFPSAAIPKIKRQLESSPTPKERAETDKLVVDMGYPLNNEYVVATYGEGFKQDEESGTPVILDSAQLTAFVSLITAAQQAGWSSEMVKTALQISFPHVPDDLLNKMAESMKDAPPPADPNAPQPTGAPQQPQQPKPAPSLDDVAAQFAEALDEVALQFEVEFKLKEGTTKEVNGKQYILKNSRWTRADKAPKAPKAPKADKAEKKPKAATTKPLSETQKVKKEKIIKDAGIESKKPKAEPKPKVEKKPKAETEPKAKIPKDAEKIGQGAFNEVYEGKDGLIYRKNPQAQLEDSKSAMNMQNIVADIGLAPRVFAVSKDTMVMEKARGTELSDVKNFNKAEYEKASEQALEAVLKMHKAGIAHRDIHDGNIMYDKRRGISIIDFDSALKGDPGNPLQVQDIKDFLRFTRMPKSALAKQVQLEIKNNTYEKFLQDR